MLDVKMRGLGRVPHQKGRKKGAESADRVLHLASMQKTLSKQQGEQRDKKSQLQGGEIKNTEEQRT